MEWLFEHGLKHDSLWLISSLLTGFIFLYDERSWRGLSRHGLHHELRRFRTHLTPLVTLLVLLPWPVSHMRGLVVHITLTLVSAAIFRVYQRTAFAFGGRPITGATRRILFIITAVLTLAALLPGVPSVMVPLLFMIAAAASSLSARNYLIFHLSEESMAIRQRLLSTRADQHNTTLLEIPAANSAARADNAGDNTLKAG